MGKGMGCVYDAHLGKNIYVNGGEGSSNSRGTGGDTRSGGGGSGYGYGYGEPYSAHTDEY